MGHRTRIFVLAAAALVAAEAAPAQDVSGLIGVSPTNRSADAASIRAIVGLVADRSGSAAVRERARAIDLDGRLTIGVDELLAEIGAIAALGMPPTVAAIPTPLPVVTAIAPTAPLEQVPVLTAEPAPTEAAAPEPSPATTEAIAAEATTVATTVAPTDREATPTPAEPGRKSRIILLFGPSDRAIAGAGSN